MDKVPLKKTDKKTQEIRDAQIFANGAPTISLRDFIDFLLAEAIGVNNTLPTFYKLVEEYGMVVYDKVIEGQIVSSNELLRSLRNRDQQVPHYIMPLNVKDFIEGKDLNFWKTLEKECRYSVLRDDVSTAYCHAGESEFPWFNIYGGLVWLNIEEYTKTVNSGIHEIPKIAQDKNKKPLKRVTKLNDWLREKWNEWGKPNAKDFAAKLKPLQGQLGSPVKKYHGWYPDVVVEWETGWGSPGGSWGSRAFQNKVSNFRKEDKVELEK
jgi:hypothetical protein